MYDLDDEENGKSTRVFGDKPRRLLVCIQFVYAFAQAARQLVSFF